MTSKPVEDFLALYPRANTRNVYHSGISLFFRTVYKNSEKSLDELAEKYLSEKQDIVGDLLAFAVSLNGRAPHTGRAYFSAIKEFLANNRIEITTHDLKRIKFKLPKGRRARTVEMDMGVDTIKTILAHSDLKLKALILTLLSSGARINEILQARLQDIDLEKRPVEITIRAGTTKGQEGRYTFISDEAAESIREWLKVRPAYLKASEHKADGLPAGGKKTQDDPRVFPFSDETARAMWNRALVKAGLYQKDEATNRAQLHYHMLRKVFRSQIGLKIGPDIAESLMGHEGYLSGAYRRFEKKQVADLYLKAMGAVTVYSGEEISSVKKEFSEHVSRLEAENQKLREEVRRIEAVRLEREYEGEGPRTLVDELFSGLSLHERKELFSEMLELAQKAKARKK